MDTTVVAESSHLRKRPADWRANVIRVERGVKLITTVVWSRRYAFESVVAGHCPGNCSANFDRCYGCAACIVLPLEIRALHGSCSWGCRRRRG